MRFSDSVVVCAGGLLLITGSAFGQTVSHLQGDYTFTGPSVYNSEAASVTTTVETSPTPTTITAPAFVYPELDAPTAVDAADGFSLQGRYDFQNGSGTGAQVVISGYRPLTLIDPVAVTASEVNGLFGIGSDDFTSPITGNSVDITGNTGETLSSFTVATALVPAGTSTNDATSTASGASGLVPLDPNFPTGALDSTGPEEYTGPVNLPAGNYDLVQTVTINFTSLLPGEPIDIALPEPASLAGIGLMSLLMVNRRRRTI